MDRDEDQGQHPRRRSSDRERPDYDDTQRVYPPTPAAPGAWQDPKTWMTLFGLLLTICGLLLTVTIWTATRMLEEIKGVNASIAALDRSASNSFTLQGRDIKYLTDDQARTWAFLRDQNAYNFNMNKAMTEMVTTMRMRGLPVPNIPEPPKLGGQ